jgi:hypothetical protein
MDESKQNVFKTGFDEMFSSGVVPRRLGLARLSSPHQEPRVPWSGLIDKHGVD